MKRHALVSFVFSNLALQYNSQRVDKFETSLLPIGAFTEIKQSTANGLVACLSSCDPNNGCNAVIFDSNICNIGTVDLNFMDSAPKKSFYVEQDAICEQNFKDKYVEFPIRKAINRKLVFLGNSIEARDALKYCQSLAASLVTLNTAEEFHAIANITDSICEHKSEDDYPMFANRKAVNGKLMLKGDKTEAQNAQGYCQSLNASLVVLKSQEEFDGLANLTVGSSSAHIGLTSGGYISNCEDEECGGKLNWLDGTVFRYSRNIGYILINEGGLYLRSFSNGTTIRLDDSNKSYPSDTICQVPCSMF